MRDDIRQALDIDPSATVHERTIDITNVGRRGGQERRIEICFYRVAGAIYLTGVPGPKRRDWLINLEGNPSFSFHLKNSAPYGSLIKAVAPMRSVARRARP